MEANDKRTVCIKFAEIIDEWCEECGFEATNEWQIELAISLWDSLGIKEKIKCSIGHHELQMVCKKCDEIIE